MRVKVGTHKVELIKEQPVNEKEIDVSKCVFEFDDEITDDYVKEAYFTLNGETYKQIIVNNECDFPSEVLIEKGDVELGVVAYKVEDEEEIKRYNPSPAYFNTWVGSLKEAKNSEPITPSDKEQIEQMLSNINMTITKDGRITTITFTNKDGTTQTETLEDGKSLEFNWDGTSLGIRQEGQSNYQYVNLQGPQGEPGAIKMVIVNSLPSTGDSDTIYLVPVQDPETGNNYEEYIYVNNTWEKLGGIQVEVDLTDYVKNTDYASSNTGGVIKIGYHQFNISEGRPFANNLQYSDYLNTSNVSFISKGTLENVITGKGLVSNTDYASSSTGGVIKTDNSSRLYVYNGNLRVQEDLYSTYLTSIGNSFISKGTLENVITGKGLVSNTNYATDSVGGVIKTGGGYNSYVDYRGVLYAGTRTYQQYGTDSNSSIISKGTLENVLTARIGDIETLLEVLDIGSGARELE